jgi:hypothetical protein
MFVGEQRVVAAARFLDRAVHHALGGFTNLALCDIEVVHGTDPPDPPSPDDLRESTFWFRGKKEATACDSKHWQNGRAKWRGPYELPSRRSQQMAPGRGNARGRRTVTFGKWGTFEPRP